jgi:hypothetical protein
LRLFLLYWLWYRADRIQKTREGIKDKNHLSENRKHHRYDLDERDHLKDRRTELVPLLASRKSQERRDSTEVLRTLSEMNTGETQMELIEDIMTLVEKLTTKIGGLRDGLSNSVSLRGIGSIRDHLQVSVLHDLLVGKSRGVGTGINQGLKLLSLSGERFLPEVVGFVRENIPVSRLTLFTCGDRLVGYAAEFFKNLDATKDTASADVGRIPDLVLSESLGECVSHRAIDVEVPSRASIESHLIDNRITAIINSATSKYHSETAT